jgi:tetratricopeptide (TPR) repeat protein
MAHLQKNPAWARVYWDPVAEVYVRRHGRYAELAAEREYRWTRSETDLTYLANYRRDRGTWVQAIEELRRVAAENPQNELAWEGLAQEYRAAGPAYLQEQLEALDRALAILVDNPATGRLQAERGEALFTLGRVGEAETAARQALRLDSHLLLPRWVLALAAERRGAWAEAGEQLRDLQRRLEPSDDRQGMVLERLEAVEKRLRGKRGESP